MDFSDLRKGDLKQRVRRMRNWWERLKVERAMAWLMCEDTTHYLDQIEGIEYVECPRNELDCRHYAIGDAHITDLVPGVLEHNGQPQPGDTILYGHDLNHPGHMGVWQEDGRVRSRWGDGGPVMHHRWNQVPPAFGKYAFFSTYKGIRDGEAHDRALHSESASNTG